MPDPALIDKLKRLKLATKAALVNAETVNYRIAGAINWADLTCTEATFVINEEGEEYLQVFVEEASPEAYELQRFVQAELRAEFGEVRVVTEW